MYALVKKTHSAAKIIIERFSITGSMDVLLKTHSPVENKSQIIK